MSDFMEMAENYKKIWERDLLERGQEIERLKAKNDLLRINLTVCKNDYWFMINLLERYSTDKDQAIADCISRMKFRKGIFNVLEAE